MPLQSTWPEGPPLRTLDYNLLATSAQVHAELEKTTLEISAWLAALESGLNMMVETQ